MTASTPPDPLLLVGTDACVLVEGVHLRRRPPPGQRRRSPLLPTYPSVRVLQAAMEGLFRLFLVQDAEEEARLALREYGEETELDAVLTSCIVVRVPSPPPAQVGANRERMWALLRHESDIPIAVAIKLAPERPDVFVSSNRKHWRGDDLEKELGGVAVVSSKAFASWL